MDELDREFEKIRQNIALKDWPYWFNGTDFLVYIIVEDIEDGYRLARQYSPKARAMYDLTGGLNLYGNKHLGQDAGRLFKDDDRPFPERCLFVYPEHDLVVKQQQQFVDRLCKQPEIKQVILITTCPLIVSDFFSCQCRVVTGFDGPEEAPGRKLYVLPGNVLKPKQEASDA